MIPPEAPLVISIKEARKLLGTRYKGWTNTQVRELIVKLDSLAEEYFKTVPKC